MTDPAGEAANGVAGKGEARNAALDQGASPLLPAADLEALLAAAVPIAREAGALVAAAYPRERVERTKSSDHDLVTDTDQASERLITARLRARFPDHGLLAEEGGLVAEGSSGIYWAVDPLDGTNNFAHGFPLFAVNLAALVGQEILCGVTYDPLRDELFAARAGGGASLNGRRLAVSGRGRLAVALVATGFPYDKATNPDNNLAQVVAVTPHVRGLRRGGSAALDLAYVAAGRLEAYWERGTQIWDVAPGLLMVREAGGRVTDYEGRPPRPDGGRFLASNGLVHAELLECLRCAKPLTS